jgi:hypothetical protein
MAADEPGQQRGHLQDGILGQQRCQCAGVGVLNGRGEPLQQRPPVRLGGLGKRIFGGERTRELGAGPPQAAVHRRGRRAQQLRHLRGRPLQHVPQDQHRALPGTQVLQRRDQGQPDPRPRHGHGGRILLLSGHQRVGKRLQPRHLRRGHQRRLRVATRCAQARRQRPPAAALDRGQARVGGDPVQPGPHRRTARKPVIGPPRPQVALLDQVLGLLDRAQHPVAVCSSPRNRPVRLVNSSLTVIGQPQTRPREQQPCAGSSIHHHYEVRSGIAMTEVQVNSW